MNENFELHREDIKHAIVDVEATLAEMGVGYELRLGLEAVAAMKANLYRGESESPEQCVRDMFRWQILSCLLGTNWESEDVKEALQAGISRERIMKTHERERAALLAQARFVGAALHRCIASLGEPPRLTPAL